MKHSLIATVAIAIVVLARSSIAIAAPPAPEALAKIAQDICVKPELYGFTRSASGEVDGQFNVPKIMKRFVDLGLNAQVRASAGDWRGVPQNEMAGSLSDYRQCAEKMMTILTQVYATPPRAAAPAPEPRHSGPPAVQGNCNNLGINYGEICPQTNVPSPTWQFSGWRPTVKRADGTFERIVVIDVDSPFALNNVTFMIRGQTVTAISVGGDVNDHGPQMNEGSGTLSGGGYWEAVQSPTTGRFLVHITTTDEDTPAEVHVAFNARVP
jgi:hypothetical protein